MFAIKAIFYVGIISRKTYAKTKDKILNFCDFDCFFEKSSTNLLGIKSHFKKLPHFISLSLSFI